MDTFYQAVLPTGVSDWRMSIRRKLCYCSNSTCYVYFYQAKEVTSRWGSHQNGCFQAAETTSHHAAQPLVSYMPFYVAAYALSDI
jgi:hypothetical protein